MSWLRHTRMVMAVPLVALFALGACNAKEEVSLPDEPAREVQTGPSCDDLDSYCNKSRPCPEGFTCALDTNNCGTNYFGTYPYCGATDTCYPACQPNPSCDDFDDFCDAAHPCPSGYTCGFGKHCGTNYFGTYPNCGATDTCYPVCIAD